MTKVIQKIQRLEDQARKRYERHILYLQKSRRDEAEYKSLVFKAQRLREQVTV